MNAQVCSWRSLKQSADMTQDPLDREHVTLHIRKNPQIFRPIYLVADQSNYWPELGLELDEIDDYKLLKLVIEHFGDAHPFFSCAETIDLLRKQPDWLQINRQVVRKGDV